MPTNETPAQTLAREGEPMAAVQPSHPLMQEWTKYIATPEFANTKYWAQFHSHIQGSLWGAFCAGFNARESMVEHEIQEAILEYRGDLRA